MSTLYIPDTCLLPTSQLYLLSSSYDCINKTSQPSYLPKHSHSCFSVSLSVCLNYPKGIELSVLVITIPLLQYTGVKRPMPEGHFPLGLLVLTQDIMLQLFSSHVFLSSSGAYAHAKHNVGMLYWRSTCVYDTQHNTANTLGRGFILTTLASPHPQYPIAHSGSNADINACRTAIIKSSQLIHGMAGNQTCDLLIRGKRFTP